MGAFDDKPTERQVNKQRDWAKQDQQGLDNAVRAMLMHADTRRYLYWLLEIGKAIGHNPATGNALSTHFNCGEMNVGQKIMAHMIDVDPDGFLAVLKERENERKQRDMELGELRGEGA